MSERALAREGAADAVGDRQCDKCDKQGTHLCEPRALKVAKFFAKTLVHTKGAYAGKPFILSKWQWQDIIRPLFGWVEWSDEWANEDREGLWVRKFTIAWIEIARKNGKSELMAGIVIYLLCADGELGADIYGVARDKEQAGIVFGVAARMVAMSPHLSIRLRVVPSDKEIHHDESGSFYKTLASDELGNLGLNPHGVVLDEALAQRDARLFGALRQGMGTRAQPMMVCATTAGTEDSSFYVTEHDYNERVAVDPEYDPSRFVYMRNLPPEADVWDEDNWHIPNPGLGDFLSLSFLRKEARMAKNDPNKENSFRQFHMNQRVAQKTRWMPMHVWDLCTGEIARTPSEADERAKGQRCFGGLDLSSKVDLCALCWCFPALKNYFLWRFWIPGGQVNKLDRVTAGQVSRWIREGWIFQCEGNAIVYEDIYAQIDRDRQFFDVVDLNYDPWMSAAIIQRLEERGLESVQIRQGFQMSEPIKEHMRWVQTQEMHHAGNPVARWNYGCAEIKQDDKERQFLVKPKRDQTGARIDGVVAAVMATDGVMRRGTTSKKKYKTASF